MTEPTLTVHERCAQRTTELIGRRILFKIPMHPCVMEGCIDKKSNNGFVHLVDRWSHEIGWFLPIDVDILEELQEQPDFCPTCGRDLTKEE